MINATLGNQLSLYRETEGYGGTARTLTGGPWQGNLAGGRWQEEAWHGLVQHRV